MKIIGLTGKSGSGKSTISKFLYNVGYDIIDVDMFHKEVVSKERKNIDKLFEKYGYGDLEYRRKVQLFFEDLKLRKEVNEIVYPKLKEVIKAELSLGDSNLLILDAPLLYEIGLDTLCDEVWYVKCDMELNLSRLMSRVKIDRQEALIRYNAINFENRKWNLVINTNDEKYKPELLNHINKILSD